MKTKIYLFILTLLLSVGNAWAAATTLASGTISGTQITWKVDYEGNEFYLKLEGSGALPNNMTTPPWADCTTTAVINGKTMTIEHHDYRPEIKWLFIGSAITSVNNTVLGGLSNLLTIRIKNGSSVTTESNYCKVEDGVLYQYLPSQDSSHPRKLIIYPAKMIKITEYVVPNDVTAIDVNAFNENKYIKSLYIEGDITSIGAGAFDKCSNLSLIHFRNDYTFTGSLSNYTYSGVASTGKLITGHRAATNKETKHITAPSGWEHLEHYDVGLLDRGYALLHEGNLYIYNPTGGQYQINAVSPQPSDYPWNSSRSDITSLTIGKGITDIDEAALSGGYSNLRTITVEDGNTTYTVENNALCKGNTLVVYAQASEATKFAVPESITKIGAGAFYKAQNLTEVDFLGNVTALGEKAFYYCTSLSRFRFHTNTVQPTIGSLALMHVANNGILSYGVNGQFSDMLSTLNNTTIGGGGIWTRGYFDTESNGNTWCLEAGVLTVNGTSSISSNSGWNGLKNDITKIVIGEGIPKIGDLAFKNYSGLNELTLNGGGEIGDGAFLNCSNLAKINIGSNVKSFHYRIYNSGNIDTSFEGCNNIKEVDLSDLEAWCNIEHNDVLFDEEKEYTLLCDGVVHRVDDPLEIPASVENVRSSFKYFSNVQTIRIPVGRERVANSEFIGYKHLQNIVLPDGLKTIEYAAFRDCSSLVYVTIPRSVEEIGALAFCNCTSLQLLVLNGGGEIGDGAFLNCSNLAKINIGSNVKSFHYRIYNNGNIDTSFEGCNNIKEVDLSDLEAWCNIKNNDVLFNEEKDYTLLCDGVVHRVDDPLEIPASVENVRSSFKYFSNVQTIRIPVGRERVANSEFKGYKHLQNIVLPNGLKTIEYAAFRDCSSLVYVTIPSSVEEIGTLAFCGCTHMIELNLNGGGQIDELAFLNCSNLKTINIGKNVSSFYYKKYNSGNIDTSFEGCDNIQKVRIKDLMAYCKIQNIRALTEAGIPNKQLLIGEGTNVPITSLEIPAGVTDIEAYAFYNLGGTTLQEIKLPPTLQRINEYAFGGTPILTVYSYAPKHPNASNKSIDHPEEATLYVPTGSKTDYEGSSPWKYFKNIVEIDVDFPQLNTNYIEARVGDAPVPLTMPGHTITNVISSNPDVAEWKNGKVVTHASYYNGQGRYTRNNGALLTVIDENNLVAYCSVKVIPQAQLTDGQAYTNPNDEMMESVVYTRTFKDSQANKWQAFLIPFELNVEDYADDFDFAQIYAICPTKNTNDDDIIDADDEKVMILSYKRRGNTSANVPYMIRPKRAFTANLMAANCTLHQVESHPLEFSTTVTKYTVNGIYDGFTAVPGDHNYYMGGGYLSFATEETGNVNVGPFRWYMQEESLNYGGVAPDENQSSQTRMRVAVLGEDLDEETAIRLVNGDVISSSQSKDAYIYNLNGTRVNENAPLAKGMYIKNGKAIIVK